MKVAVVGCRGMLGADIMRVFRGAGIETLGYDLPELDITREVSVLEGTGAAWVVNAAAYTDVDGAEANEAAAAAVNARGAGNLASLCARAGCSLLHISTDYVFDGTARAPYDENAEPRPLNAYGRTKLAGETLIRSSGCEYLIVRTQALFGKQGRNFVSTVADRLSRGEAPLRVVRDQITCPTYTAHLAQAIFRLIMLPAHGTVNVSASGECSWHELALAVAGLVRPGAAVEPICAAECGRPARRPAYSVLDKSLYRRLTGETMPHWTAGLKQYAAEMGWAAGDSGGGGE